MRISRFIAALSALLFLSGCYDTPYTSNTYHDVYRWTHNKPSKIGYGWVGDMPSGFYGQNAAGRAVLKPPGMEPEYAPPLAWNETTVYDEPPPVTDSRPIPGEPVQYSDSVSVYPLDGETAPMRNYVNAPPQDMVYVDTEVYGDMVQEIFFAHGSARIGSNDKRHLVSFAKGVHSNNGLALTVVGHASTRVNTTDDPVRKKEINFEVAQKRANAVTGVLTEAGVSPSWVMSVSRGDDEPNTHSGKRSQEAADRRVEVFMGGR